MKCLSVQQPWAWAIIHGPKRIENRRWLTRYRGPLLIHAGRSKLRIGDEGDSLPELPPYCTLPFGCLIGQVELVDCLPLEQVNGQPFAEGPFCWILASPKALPEPIPYRGHQQIFNVPDEVLQLPADQW